MEHSSRSVLLAHFLFKLVVLIITLLAFCCMSLAKTSPRITAIPYIDRRASWLVLWNNSTGPNGTPRDETWTIAINDRVVSMRQGRTFQVISNEGFEGTFPTKGPLVLHRHVRIDSDPALAVRIYWPDNLPESITFQITLKVQDGNLESTSKPHLARLWKALRSSSPDLPSLTPDAANHDLLHYNASWIGGPGPIRTSWELTEGLIMWMPPSPNSRFYDLLHYPWVHAEYTWLDAYDPLPWFSDLSDDNWFTFGPNDDQEVTLNRVAHGTFEGSSGTYSIPVSLRLLTPLNALMSTLFDFDDASGTAVAWSASATGAVDASTDAYVSDYCANTEIVPFTTGEVGGHRSIVIDL
jgi:hypothetical protein